MGKHFERAEVLFEQGRHDLAIGELRQELAIDPDCGDSHSLLGRCLVQQHKYDEAEIELSASIRLEPERNDFHHALAACYLLQKRLDIAKKTIQEAIRLDPEEPQHLFCLALILLEEGNKLYVQGTGSIFHTESLHRKAKNCWQESLDLLGEARRLNPTEVSYVQAQVNIAEKLGNSSLNAKYTEEAIALDPESALAHSDYGWLLLKKGEYLKARDYFKSALQIEADSSEAKNGLLESLRAEFWLYRWLSCHYQIPNTDIPAGVLPIGIFFLSLLLSFIFGSLEPLIKQYLSPTVNTILIKLCILLGLGSFFWLIVSQLSPYIFNWFLQFNPLGRRMLSQKDFIRASIWGVFGIGGTVFLGSMFVISPDVFPTREMRERFMLIELGVCISLLPWALIPSLDGDRSRKIMSMYSAISTFFGTISLAIYTLFNQIESSWGLATASVYLISVLASPWVALLLNKNRNLQKRSLGVQE